MCFYFSCTDSVSLSLSRSSAHFSSNVTHYSFCRSEPCTLLDLLDASSGAWEAITLPFECWRAGPRYGNVTLLCSKGIVILSTLDNASSVTWSLVPFMSAITSDDLRNITIGSDLVKRELDAFFFGSMQLLSPNLPRSCGGVLTASSDNWVMFIGDLGQGKAGAVRYRGASIPALKYIDFNVPPLLNARYGAAVAYQGLSGGFVVAGGECVIE